MNKPIDVDPALRGRDGLVGFPKRLRDPLVALTEQPQFDESMFIEEDQGLKKVGDFLRTRDFSVVQPFMLDVANARRDVEDKARFNIGKIGGKKQILHLPADVSR